MIDFTIKCICCGRLILFEKMKQIVVLPENKKVLYCCWCCVECLKDKKDGDFVTNIDSHGKLFLQDNVHLDLGYLENMIANRSCTDYHYQLYKK